MEIRDTKTRNKNARTGIKMLKEDKGVSYSFLARSLSMPVDSFAHWRAAKYEFGIQKLKEVEALIQQYAA